MSVDVTHEGPAIALAGQLDGRCLAEVREALYDHIKKNPGDVVVDLARVESIDVTAFRMLVACALRLERTGRRIVLRSCSPALRRLFAFTGWRRLFLMERARGE
jgi:anti-anti-sigma factor